MLPDRLLVTRGWKGGSQNSKKSSTKFLCRRYDAKRTKFFLNKANEVCVDLCLPEQVKQDCAMQQWMLADNKMMCVMHAVALCEKVLFLLFQSFVIMLSDHDHIAHSDCFLLADCRCLMVSQQSLLLNLCNSELPLRLNYNFLATIIPWKTGQKFRLQVVDKFLYKCWRLRCLDNR